MLSKLQTNGYQPIQLATTFELIRSIVTMSLHFAELSLQMWRDLYVKDRLPSFQNRTPLAILASGVRFKYFGSDRPSVRS